MQGARKHADASLIPVAVVWLVCAVGEDGELPPELTKHDPRLVEAVCNDVGLLGPLTATQLCCGKGV